MKKYILIFLFLVFGVSSKYVFAVSSNETALRVGTASGYYPFVSLDNNGEYEGFDIDIVQELAKKMNKKLVIKDFGSMPSLFMAIKTKKVDLIIWGISITEDRKKELSLVHYQGDLEDEIPVLFWKEVPLEIDSLSDLTQVCVEAGSCQDNTMSFYQANVAVKKVDTIVDAVLEVKYGKSSAVAVDPSIVSTLISQTPDLQVKYFSLPVELQSQGNGIGILKENNEFTALIGQKIDELKSEEVIANLEKKWGLVKQ